MPGLWWRMKTRTNTHIFSSTVAMVRAPRLWEKRLLQRTRRQAARLRVVRQQSPTMGPSAYAAWMLLWLGCLLGLGVRGESAAPEGPIVNLYRGEINGTRFSAMTVDTMRTLLGPPSVVEEPESRQEDQGTRIQYHAFGLSFAMPHPRDQAPLQCWRVRLYLTKTWDARAGTFFVPFSGRLSKQVSQDWTPQRIATAFREWSPHSAPQEQVAALGHEEQGAQAAPETYRVLSLDMGDFRVDFFYAHTAQRLQAIELTRPRAVPPAPR